MDKHILVIDDEELLLKTLERVLKKIGYDVTLCNKGEEGIDFMRRGKTDLIICDVRMPGLSGVETIKQIRHIIRERRLQPIPEIVMTGYANEQSNVEIEALQVNSYIYKPFDINDFLTCINNALISAEF